MALKTFVRPDSQSPLGGQRRSTLGQDCWLGTSSPPSPFTRSFLSVLWPQKAGSWAGVTCELTYRSWKPGGVEKWSLRKGSPSSACPGSCYSGQWIDRALGDSQRFFSPSDQSSPRALASSCCPKRGCLGQDTAAAVWEAEVLGGQKA